MPTSLRQMRALLCPAYGGPEVLSVARVDVPTPAKGQLLVRVEAAGLNFADLVLLKGEYQDQPEPPFVPGAEVCGEICAMPDPVEGFSIGDRVMGQVRAGAYAEYAVMDPRQSVRLSVDMPGTEAGAFFINYGTGYSALVQRASAIAGNSVLILGAAGGVGLATLQIAKALGMTVVADCRGSEKQALARVHGADLVIDHTSPDFRDEVRAITGGAGCDVAIDMIGGEATRAALRCIGWCGRIVIIGFAGGAPHLIPANHLLVKNCSVIGHWWGDYHWRDRTQLDAAFDHLFRLYEKRLIRPVVSEVLALDRIPEGLRRYAARTVLGKLVAMPSRHGN